MPVHFSLHSSPCCLLPVHLFCLSRMYFLIIMPTNKNYAYFIPCNMLCRTSKYTTNFFVTLAVTQQHKEWHNSLDHMHLKAILNGLHDQADLRQLITSNFVFHVSLLICLKMWRLTHNSFFGYVWHTWSSSMACSEWIISQCTSKNKPDIKVVKRV
jgi:hypothetical protein